LNTDISITLLPMGVAILPAPANDPVEVRGSFSL